MLYVNSNHRKETTIVPFRGFYPFMDLENAHGSLGSITGCSILKNSEKLVEINARNVKVTNCELQILKNRLQKFENPFVNCFFVIK